MDLGELKAKFNFWYVRKFFKLDKQYTFMLDRKSTRLNSSH